MTKAPLEALLATCTDGLIRLRDRALLLFAFSRGDRRRSEVSSAVLENLITVDDQTWVARMFLSVRRWRSPGTAACRR
jgi:hypothetical protein